MAQQFLKSDVTQTSFKHNNGKILSDSQRNTELMNFLVDRFEYGDKWTKELKQPK